MDHPDDDEAPEPVPMGDPTHELADLISEFLVIALEPESRERLTAEAKELGASYEQFLAMSLTHLITNRFQLTPVADFEGSAAEADDDV
ncbi:hypothetical protein [Paludisphaera mucosa]|uniref:BRCT domain-containing protein n=1 Tax=Paludisphaera mucosa TaxID=3030827 RepID=A0ABT6FL61_9BACT|nr:hypothetical protein [Paludisphaera mucosa]MDG3008316.1 hypothetical protein [Paludisphaera mucosa]